jgi:hypothetical protein
MDRTGFLRTRRPMGKVMPPYRVLILRGVWVVGGGKPRARGVQPPDASLQSARPPS